MVHREPARNQMTRLLDTNLWYKTYKLRRDLRALYHLSPNDTLIPYSGADEGWELRPTWRADPFNPERFNPEPDDPVPDYALMSVLTLSDAPPQPWIRPQEGTPQGEVHDHYVRSNILQNKRRLQVYTPPSYSEENEPYHLFVLYTGYYYNNPYIPGPTILDNMINAGVLPPLVTVFLDKSPDADREYGCNIPFTDFMQTELIPWIRQHYRVTSDPARTIIGGVSFTGMTAAFTGLRCSDTFGKVLSQSGWFAWKPDNEEEYEWLPRQFAMHPRLPPRFYLDVGLLENNNYGEPETCPTLLLSNRHMRTVLQAKGYPVHYAEFNGGHDGVNWRGTLSDGLIALIGER